MVLVGLHSFTFWGLLFTVCFFLYFIESFQFPFLGFLINWSFINLSFYNPPPHESINIFPPTLGSTVRFFTRVSETQWTKAHHHQLIHVHHKLQIQSVQPAVRAVGAHGNANSAQPVWGRWNKVQQVVWPLVAWILGLVSEGQACENILCVQLYMRIWRVLLCLRGFCGFKQFVV